MSGYTNIDVLKVFQKSGPLGFDDLKKEFPDRYQNFSHLLDCYNSLLSNDYIQKTRIGKMEISQLGVEELRRLTEDRDLLKRRDILQIQTLETELPLIKKKLEDYNLYKWISIISGIVSIISVGIILFNLLSHM